MRWGESISIAGLSVAGSEDMRDRRRAGRPQLGTADEVGVPDSLEAILRAVHHTALHEPAGNGEYV